MNHHASSMSFTIVDALDTLKIMGLEAEFDAGRNYVASIDESKFHEDVDVSFFETTIRVIGGLISAYDLSDDKMFIEKAAALADRLIPAFNTETGLPSKNKRVNISAGAIQPSLTHTHTHTQHLPLR